jgi:formylglycine-generating enzyme required for sulfatase activity
MNELTFSRRGLLGGVAAAAVSNLEAMQDAPQIGLTALLDGSAMARIQPGEFMMGSANGNADERPVHKVRIRKGFEMGKYEVTQAQWKAVMADPHKRDDGAKMLSPGGNPLSSDPSRFKGPGLPVDNVSWDDIQGFLKRLNARAPKHLYRLPTEAEWEYACRAGGSGESSLADMAWFKQNAGAETHLVGTKKPNAWGLFDMHGNVSEWVQDWYSADYYGNSPAVDPQGPALTPQTGSYRVYRGSCWYHGSEYVRPAFRSFDFPISRFDSVGFRLVRTAK